MSKRQMSKIPTTKKFLMMDWNLVLENQKLHKNKKLRLLHWHWLMATNPRFRVIWNDIKEVYKK
jgi:hypothetical protein